MGLGIWDESPRKRVGAPETQEPPIATPAGAVDGPGAEHDVGSDSSRNSFHQEVAAPTLGALV